MPQPTAPALPVRTTRIRAACRRLLLHLAALLPALAAPVAAQPFGFSAPAALHANAATDSGSDTSPRVMTDGAGTWVVAWTSDDTLGGTLGADFDILFVRSIDDGATWTAPAALNTNAATDSGADDSVSLSTDGAGNWIAVWRSTDTLGGTIGTDQDILVARSADSGATWTAPAALNSTAASDTATDTFPSAENDGAGAWVVAWTSNNTLGGTIGSDFDVLVARSSDSGATWTATAALNANAATDTGVDSNVRVTTDGGGTWIAAWSSTDTLGGTIGTDQDILVARSTDAGATWSSPAALNSNAATDTGDDLVPQLAADGAGNWVVTWYSDDALGGTIGTDDDILFTTSSDLPVELSGFALD